MVEGAEKEHEEGMVEPVYKYGVDPKLFDSLYCPTCESKLSRLQLLDIFVQGLVCGNGHRFFIEVQTPTGTESAKGSTIEGALEGNVLGTITAWLTQPQLRSKLNNQLATIVRRIYEISKQDIHISLDGGTASQKIFRSCVLCTKPLEFFQQSDAWVEGLRCANGHEFRHRNGLAFSYGGRLVMFHEEMADSTVLALIPGWLTGSGGLANQLHDQLRAIMEDYQGRRTI